MPQICGNFSTSTDRFSLLFKKQSGIKMITAMTMIKMYASTEYLKHRGYKIVSIPERVGYRDYPRWAKNFKKVFGISASQYRKKHFINK